MKYNLNKLILAIVGLLLSTNALAYDFKVDGIYYNFLDHSAKTVAVTYKGSYYDSYTNEYTGSVTIPSSVTYNGTTYSVTSIGSEAFRDCTGLTSITIPNSVTSIGDFAFFGCKGLISITIPNSVTEIGNNAFSRCTRLRLRSIAIPNSVTEIGNDAFYDTPWYKTHRGTYINNVLYKYNGSATSIPIMNGTVSISPYAFWKCTGLTSVTIPNSVTEIGNDAFSGCTDLTSVTIPNSVTEIGEGVFFNCSGLTSITIPNSVTKISKNAFYGCEGLTEVNISDLSAWCKIDFKSLPLYYAKKLKLNGTEIKDLVIPNSVTNIGSCAFAGCESLKSVTIPNSVSSISPSAFDDCTGLTMVIIGEGVASIEQNVFNNTPNLKKIISFSPTPPACANKGSFYRDNYSNAILYVPKNSFAKYFTDDVWGHFTNIKKIETLATSIKLNKTLVKLKDGAYSTLKVSINPSNATIKDVIWESSNPNIVTVDQNGVITRLGIGPSTITARTIDGSNLFASCIVKSNAKISLSQTNAKIPVNGILTLNNNVIPSNTSVEWSSSNPNIAYIKENSDNSATIVGIAEGKAIITATATDGSESSVSCKVSVYNTQITLSQTEAKLPINDIITLSYKVKPSNTSIKWSTSNPDVAYIKENSDGSVSVLGQKNGEAIITATATDGSGISASCKVTVGAD